MTENEIASSSPVELARAHHSKSLTASPIYGFLLQNLVVLPSTVAGTSLSSLILEPQHLNSKGSIHGSVSATIVDWASGNALATTGSHSGVSVDMHVTFMNTCKGGEKMIIKVRESCPSSEGGLKNRCGGIHAHYRESSIRRAVDWLSLESRSDENGMMRWS
jgi:hypothetical protein